MLPSKLCICQNEEEYKKLVRKSLLAIGEGHYDKIIASRQINLQQRLDIIETLSQGRRSNNPKRTFLVRHGEFEVTGFSPGLVVVVQTIK